MLAAYAKAGGATKTLIFLPLDEAIASRAVIVIVSGSDGRTESLLEPAN